MFINSFLFFILFEALEPSYGLFTAIMPEQIVLETMAAGTTGGRIIKRSESIAPAVDAKSIYSIDLTSGTPLLVRDVFSRRPIASITKLMTAIVILDSHVLEDIVTVSKNAANQEGSKMGLYAGEQITVKNLLTGMLINSGNDAAVALAEFDSGTELNFTARLNAKAAELGLKNTHFSNAKGFDNRYNYSNAFDIMEITKIALSFDVIDEIVSQKNTEVLSSNGKISHKLTNTNELLDDPYFDIIGVKTGTTPEAGQSFVSLFNGPDGHQIATVMLGSPNRFKETKIVLDWITRNYEFQLQDN